LNINVHKLGGKALRPHFLQDRFAVCLLPVVLFERDRALVNTYLDAEHWVCCKNGRSVVVLFFRDRERYKNVSCGHAALVVV
jgi:hypothetical protein